MSGKVTFVANTDLSSPFMKEKIAAPLFALLMFCSALRAQYEDLLNNNNVSWVAEYTADFTLDPFNCDYGAYEFNNALNVIQLNNLTTKNGLHESRYLAKLFSQKIFEGIRRGDYLLFMDEQLEIPISLEKMLAQFDAMDTVVTFDPETYEERVLIVRGEMNWESTTSFRVRQVFFYDKSQKTFGSRLLAIAPLAYSKEGEGLFVEEYKTVVWLKIEPPPKNWEKANPKDSEYAFETYMKSNAPRLSDFVLKKGRMDFLSLIVNEVAKPSHPVLDEKLEPIAPEKLQDYVQSVDTVVTFNTETFEERVDIVQRNAIKDVSEICFVQQWMCDFQKKTLFNRVSAVAPVVTSRDETGYPRYSKVLFYMMNK